MGSRAEQLTKGLMSMVMSRLERLSMERVAIMEGTVQPNPITSGMNDLPCSPRRCMSLSMMKAARAM